jgi:hypothetical protein
MLRMPMMIFNETVVAGTVLFRTSLLKGALSPPLRQSRTTSCAAIERFGSTAGRVLTPRSSHPELPLSVGSGRVKRPDLPVRAMSRVKSSRGSAGLFRRSACRYREPVRTVAIELARSSPSRRGTRRMRAGLLCRLSGWLALDVNRSAFMNGPSTYDARLLLLENPTPRARTYADRPSELSREVTLVGEAALCGHIGERQPVIAQLFLG